MRARRQGRSWVCSWSFLTSSKLIGFNLYQHNLRRFIDLTLMDFGHATLRTEYSRTVAREREVRPLFTMRTLDERH